MPDTFTVPPPPTGFFDTSGLNYATRNEPTIGPHRMLWELPRRYYDQTAKTAQDQDISGITDEAKYHGFSRIPDPWYRYGR